MVSLVSVVFLYSERYPVKYTTALRHGNSGICFKLRLQWEDIRIKICKSHVLQTQITIRMLRNKTKTICIKSKIVFTNMFKFCDTTLNCNQTCIKGTFEHQDLHYDDVTMSAIASQITSLAIVYSIVYSDADQSKHQSSASLAFVWRIHRGPVNSPHKWPVTRKMFPFDDVIMV